MKVPAIIVAAILGGLMLWIGGIVIGVSLIEREELVRTGLDTQPCYSGTDPNLGIPPCPRRRRATIPE